MSHPDPKRPELHIMRVANGWVIQLSAVAQPINPETGEPFTPNAAGAHVARTPEELGGILVDWARKQMPASEQPVSTLAAATMRAVPAFGVAGVLGAQVGDLHPDPSLLSRNRDD